LQRLFSFQQGITCRLVLERQLEQQERRQLRVQQERLRVLHQLERLQVLGQRLVLELALLLLFCHKRLK
jgi:hypothetical protein